LAGRRLFKPARAADEQDRPCSAIIYCPDLSFIPGEVRKHMYNMHEDIETILITDEEIQAKVAELGQQIKRDYQDINLLLLGTLKGAVPFIGDLARAIRLPVEIDYMAVSSYGNATESSGIVRILKDLEGPVQQKHI